jgi:hypothetical protein
MMAAVPLSELERQLQVRRIVYLELCINTCSHLHTTYIQQRGALRSCGLNH